MSSRQATENELATAREIAQYLGGRGGSAALPLDAVLEAFGITRFTAASRDRIAEALQAARVTAEPSIHDAQRGDLVTFTTRERVRVASAATPRQSRPAGQPKPPWYKRPLGIAAIAVVVLFILVGGLAPDPERTEADQQAAAAATATPTPTPTATPVSREAAVAEAEDALKDADYAAVLVAAASFEDDDNALVGHYKRKIARKILRAARRDIRSGNYARAATSAKRSRRYRNTTNASRIIRTANARLAFERARKREQARLARIARDNRTCTSSEKSTVRYGGGTPAGCSDFAIDLADRQAGRAAEEAAAAAPPVDDYGDSSDDSSSSGGTGNWCGATRDGDGRRHLVRRPIARRAQDASTKTHGRREAGSSRRSSRSRARGLRRPA